MSVYLTSQSSSYLQSMKIDAANLTAITAAKDNALAKLQITLMTGDPIDAATVNFLIDYHNDSQANMDAMRQFLDGPDRKLEYYLDTVRQGIAPALAPFLANGIFVPNKDRRSVLIAAGLGHGSNANAEPPATAIAALAQGGIFRYPDSSLDHDGAALARTWAEHYIGHAASRNLPIADELMDAYVNLGVLDSTQFIRDTLLAGNSASKPLMDAYLALNPIDANSLDPAWDAMLTGMNLDKGFLARIGLPSSPNPPLYGWVTLAMKQIKDTPLHKPVDKALLAQLRDVSPMAAAWIAYDRLHRQISDPGRPELEPALLDAVGAYNKDVLASTANRALEWWLRPTNELMDGDGLPNDGRVRTNTPQIKVDLYGMGGAPQVGDKLKFYLDGTENKTVTLTADDIGKGFVLVTPASALNYNQNYAITTAIESKADQSLSPLSTPLRIVADNTGPHTINSFSYPLNGKNYGALIFNEPIDGTPNLAGLSVEVRVNGNWQAVPFAVHALGRMVNFELPAGLSAEVRYAIKDTAGNVGTQTLSIALNTSETGPGLLSSYPGPHQLAGMMDHNAYQALHQVDPTAARGWFTRYSNAGLLGPAPAPPAPPPGQGPGPAPAPGASDPLSPDDLLALDVETLVHQVFMGRFDGLDRLLKEQLASVQKINEDMSRLSDVLGAVNALVEHIPSEAERSKKIGDIYSGHTPLGNKINAAILAIPGLRLFEENQTDGLYHGGMVTKGGLLAVQQTLKAKLDSLSNMQQHETLRMQMMNSKRLEVLTAISNIMEAANNCKKDILRNMA